MSDADEFVSGGTITNIAKMFVLFGGLDPQYYPDRKLFYYPGIGTYHKSRLLNLWEQAFPTVEGAYREIISRAEIDFDSVMDASVKDGGYDIYIFGFSRGAAIARKFSWYLGEQNIPVRFLGVFDTVVSAGAPDIDGTPSASDVEFCNGGHLSKNVQAAAHAISIDERRGHFAVMPIEKDERVTQTLFTGTHTDIGGGFWESGLSDITCRWMIHHADDNGLADRHDYLGISKANLKKAGLTLDDLPSYRQMYEYLAPIHAHDLPIDGKPREFSDMGVGESLIHTSVTDRLNSRTGYRPAALRGLGILL